MSSRPLNKARAIFAPAQEESKIETTTKPTNGHLAALLQAEQKTSPRKKK